jgi:hypothetical protein
MKEIIFNQRLRVNRRFDPVNPDSLTLTPSPKQRAAIRAIDGSGFLAYGFAISRRS